MQAGMRIERPTPDTSGEISALALRSKGHWGYDADFLEACRDELTYTEPDLTSGDVRAAYAGDALVGFVVVRGSGPVGELSALFVDPQWIGTGVGRMLLEHALELARSRGIGRLELDADPGAESFYAHHGARTVARAPSGSIPGRTLPHMVFALGEGSPEERRG